MMQTKTMLAFAAALLLLLALAAVIALSIRGANRAAQTPAVSVAEVQTQAVATFASDMTRTAEAMPTDTSTSTPAPTSTPVATSAVSATPSCYRLLYIKDVTIPDNTPMTPAEVFTKTWQVENNGTCTWRPGFQLVLIGGVAMGGSPFTLTELVNPGERLDISIKMAAPTNQTGTIQGTWRITDDKGTFFGDALTVVIVVGNATGTPPTAEATAISTP